MVSTNIYLPFTYCITFIPTGQRYYGVRTAKNCNPSELWNTYFTSSSYIRDLIQEYGKDSFTYQIRRTFSNKYDAIMWETKVLTRLNASKNPNWLNKSNGGENFLTTDESIAKGLDTKRNWSDDKREEFSRRLSEHFKKFHKEAPVELLLELRKKQSHTLQNKPQSYWDERAEKKRLTNSLKSDDVLQQERLNYAEASKARWAVKLANSSILECPNCSKKFIVKPYYDRHISKCMSIVFKHRCSECGKVYNDPKWLKLHIKKHHSCSDITKSPTDNPL